MTASIGFGACTTGARLVCVCVCNSRVRSLDQREEQVVAAYFSPHHPLPLSPSFVLHASLGLPCFFFFLFAVAGVKGQTRKRLLAQSQTHSSIPVQSKSEQTRPPSPGDQLAGSVL